MIPDVFGRQALYSCTTGTNNSVFGRGAGFNITTGGYNTAMGYNALVNTTTASYNTAVGRLSMTSNTTGASNTAVGNYCLPGNTTGNNNVAIGDSALQFNTIASNNVAVGYVALNSANRTADANGQNTALGNSAGSNLTTGQNCIFLGYNTQPSIVGANSQFVIGVNQSSAGDNYITIGTGGVNAIYNQFTVNATWTRASDKRIKKNIQDIDIGLSFINDLKVKSYNWKPNNEFPEHIDGYSEVNTQDTESTIYGLIAQDVKAAMDKHGYEHFGGWDERASDGLQGVSTESFVFPLINAVKELSAQVELLKSEVATLKGA